MKKYEQIDISGDAGLMVRGSTLEELFANAAEGMFSLITDVSVIKETETREIIIDSDSIEDLFVSWLNELVFIFDTYGFTGKSFSVRIEGSTLRAGVSGGAFDREAGGSSLLIKAATYHCLSVKKTNSYWEATVIFDI